MNKIVVTGYLLEDSRTKETNQKWSILEFPIQTVEEYTNSAGAQKRREIRHNVAAFGKLAEQFKDQLKKGVYAVIEGSVQNAIYKKPDGTDGFRSEIIAKNIEIPGSPARDQSSAQAW